MKNKTLIQLNPALFVTYLGLGVAVVGINLAITGHYKYAVVALILSAVCDMLDGPVARKIKNRDKGFGIQADSLADMVSFTIFPSVIFMSLGFDHWYHIAGFVLLVLAGLMRLARFNSAPTRTHYIGLPVTFTAALFPPLYLMTVTTKGLTAELTVFIATLIITGLFVSTIKVPKPKRTGLLLYLLLAVTLIVLVVLS